MLKKPFCLFLYILTIPGAWTHRKAEAQRFSEKLLMLVMAVLMGYNIFDIVRVRLSGESIGLSSLVAYYLILLIFLSLVARANVPLDIFIAFLTRPSAKLNALCRRPIEAKRRAKEAAREAERRQAEEKRRAAERQQAEERRKAEEKRRAEEERRRREAPLAEARWILQVVVPYSKKDLVRARNRQLKRWHPDQPNGSTEISQKINAAYELLEKTV